MKFGRMPLRRLIAYYRAEPARVRHPALIVRINRLYDPDMRREDALYEATRGVWRLSPKRAAGAKYALATFEGIVLEVYQIEQWHPAGSTTYRTRLRKDVRRAGRWEFVGRRPRCDSAPIRGPLSAALPPPGTAKPRGLRRVLGGLSSVSSLRAVPRKPIAGGLGFGHTPRTGHDSGKPHRRSSGSPGDDRRGFADSR